MFCSNCGNKLDDNLYFCVNCGLMIKKRSDIKIVREKKDTMTLGVLSTIFGSISFILSIMLFFYDISSAGMYTEVYERIFFTLNYSLFAILFSSTTLIFSLVGKRNNYSNIGLVLSLISFFFIITEFIVVIVY